MIVIRFYSIGECCVMTHDGRVIGTRVRDILSANGSININISKLEAGRKKQKTGPERAEIRPKFSM